MNQNVISQTIVRLFSTERFYAELIAGMTRKYSTRVPIAGVCIKEKIELHINPKRFEALPLEERVAVLKHECEHILRGHIPRAKELHPEVYTTDKSTVVDNAINSMKHQCINVAADLAINPGIPDIPSMGMFPKKFNLPDGHTMEWYLSELKNSSKMKTNPGEVDFHELWGESDGDKELLKEKVKQAINEAAKRTKAAGRLTAEQELLISQLNAASVNWKSQLKRFVARSVETIVEASRKKRNRRYGIQVPGMIKIEELHIGAAIDTSGSVSDAALTQFMSELHIISKYAKITVVEADAEVKDSYVFDPKKQYKVKGRGGTAYKPAFDFFNKVKGIDAVIYFGDMDNYDQEELTKPKYPVLWAIVGSSKPPASFGSQLHVTVGKE